MIIKVRYSIPGFSATVRDFEGDYDYEITDAAFIVLDRDTRSQYIFSLHLTPIIEIHRDDDE